jgi:hypothetical protein
MSRAPALAFTVLVACSLSAGSAAAEETSENFDFKKESGAEHGSQVASSEWLPIVVGGTLGLASGGLIGYSFDDNQPAIAGPIIGGFLGGATGGAAGAWIIRAARDKDARTPAIIGGLAVGGAVGVVLFSKMEPEGRALETIGKYGSLAIAPVLGAITCYQLASYFQEKPVKEQPPAPVAMVPSVAPVVGRDGATGLSFSLSGAF